ncbi:MAG: hypothetical protein WDZ75_01025 [Candidatus Paceibacterota bacterium]
MGSVDSHVEDGLGMVAALKRFLKNLRRRVESGYIELRAHARMKQLTGEISVYLNQSIHHETGLSIPRSVGEIARAVRCDDQMDLEFALQALMDSGRANCFSIEPELFEAIIKAHNRAYERVPSSVDGRPYALSLRLESESVEHLSNFNEHEFWKLSFVCAQQQPVM